MFGFGISELKAKIEYLEIVMDSIRNDISEIKCFIESSKSNDNSVNGDKKEVGKKKKSLKIRM